MRRYLIVEDTEAVRFQLRTALKHAGGTSVEVIEADGIDSGWKAFVEKKPDLVFLDLMLGSGQFGVKLMENILKVNPRARIVIVTGLPADHPHVISAISNGAFTYLKKPLRLEMVQRVLQDVEAESGGLGRII